MTGLQVLMALTSAIEAAWIKVNSSKQPELKELQSLTVCAGQMEQFGVNSFALSTICNGMVRHAVSVRGSVLYILDAFMPKAAQSAELSLTGLA